MSTMVGAPRTPACRRADQDREAHGTAARGQMGRCRYPSPAERDSGTNPVLPPRGNRLRVRPRGPAGRDGYEVHAMVGAPVYPLANRTCPHWPNSASRQAAGSRCRRRTAPSCTLASMCRWSRRTGIVVGRSRSRPRGDDRERGHGPASCRSDQRVRAKRPGAHGQRPASPTSAGPDDGRP